MVDDEKVAGFLVVGFTKAWPMHAVLSAAGLDPVEKHEDAAATHGRYKFMPLDLWRYKGRGNGAREYVYAEFPKLAAFLTANAKKPERLVASIPQVVRLAAKGGAHISRLSKEDRAEMNKIKREAKAVAVSNEAARKQQLSTQRGAWNVCKG
jgi:hypothetical protein